MVYTKPENKANAVPVFFINGVTAQKLPYRITALLYWQNCFIGNIINTKKSVAGGYKMSFFGIYGAKLGLNFTAKAIIIAFKIFAFIFIPPLYEKKSHEKILIKTPS